MTPADATPADAVPDSRPTGAPAPPARLPAPVEPDREAEPAYDPPRPLLEHLDELRSRLISALAGWALATGAAYFLYPRLLPLVIRPPVTQLVYTSPVEPFFTQCKVSLIGGILLAFPWILYQAGSFVAVGLRLRERRMLLRLIPASYLLFLIGGAVGLLVIGPVGMQFLMAYGTSQLVPFITLSAYLGYLSYVTLGLAILFQLPIVLFVLASFGILELSTLTSHRRHAALVILIAAAAVTPGPDVFSQLLIALPTYLLYELSVLAVRLTRR